MKKLLIKLIIHLILLPMGLLAGATTIVAAFARFLSDLCEDITKSIINSMRNIKYDTKEKLEEIGN